MLFTSGLNGSGFKVGVAKEQCRIGFQPVPRVHCTWPCEMETRGEWLKAVAKSVRDTGWKPMVHCSLATPTLSGRVFLE
jgi:hypothetical protein